MYLPQEIKSAKVLITVKAYPKPSSKYEELVCTAGLFEGEKWIRIYPVPFRVLAYSNRYPKYSWLTVDLIRNQSDFRPESYRPKQGLDEEFYVSKVTGTKNAWAARKSYVLKEVYSSMNELIALAKGDKKKSLATMKPKEITGFRIENADREWKESWLDHKLQASFFDLSDSGEIDARELVRKVPYDYSYQFITEGDDKSRSLKIEDWEIGALYWNCLKQTDGDEVAANELVRQKYFDEFVSERDLYFFLGTTKQFHNVGANPFMIIGVFYPPKTAKAPLF